MKSFRQYLDEALTSPEPYYLTADTDAPHRVYGAFKVDGNGYIIAMERTKTQGVYYVEMGRTKPEGGKVMWWRFHDQKDIIPAFSTLVAFSDSVIKLLGKDRFKGAAIVMRKSTAQQSIDRASRIAARIINTKFKSTLTMLPVSQEQGTTGTTNSTKLILPGTKFVFVARKGQDYKKIFGNDKEFSTYDFSGGGTLDLNAVSKMQPKKPLKKVVTTKPSSKYTFSEFDVDVPSSLDSETVEKLSNVKIQDAESSETKQMKDSDSYKKDLNFINKTIPVEKSVVSLPGLMSMNGKIYQYGFDKNKLNWNDLKYVVSNLSAPEKDILSAYGLIDIDSPTVKSDWMSIMKKVPQTSQSPEVKSFIKNNPNGNKAAAEPYEPGSSNKATKKVSNVKPTDLISTIPGGSNDVVTPQASSNPWGVTENTNKKVEHLEQTLGYYEQISKMPHYQKLISYTGDGYRGYNNPLRRVVSQLLKGEKIAKQELNTILRSQNKFMQLARMFDKITPLPDAMWVYRGTFIPPDVKEKIEPGYQFVDPAFLSTSVNAETSFGGDRMRIFLPKGSKVLPVLNHSKHKGEREVILPASSVIKVIEVYPSVGSNGRLYMQGVFMGSAFKSITDALKKQLTIAENNMTLSQALQLVRMIEQMNKQNDDNEEDYDPEDKYGGFYDADLADLINDKIKKGDFKVEGPIQEE